MAVVVVGLFVHNYVIRELLQALQFRPAPEEHVCLVLWRKSANTFVSSVVGMVVVGVKGAEHKKFGHGKC